MTSPKSGFRILIVEEDPAILHATQLLLEVNGYQVTAVATLMEALQQTHVGNGVDLVVSESYSKKFASGAEVIVALREVLGESLPAILITDDTTAPTQQPIYVHNMHTVNKPFMADRLLALLDSILTVR